MGRLVEYLAYEWSRLELPFDRVVLMAPRNVTLPSLGTTTHVELQVFGEHLPFVAWEQLALPRRARSAAVLFCPTYVGPLFNRTPVVVANHGIYERLPGEFPKLHRLRTMPLQRLSARRADRTIANSVNTRRDLVEFFKLNESEIDIVYPAANHVFFEERRPEEIAATAERVLGTQCPYFMFVGKLSRRRHVPELIQAFARLRRDHALDHRLVIVGPNTTGTDVAGLARDNGVEAFVSYVPHLDQELLAQLLAGAVAFVLPTTYEGISYTMFEAMASGAAVVTVDHPTLAEGAGDAVLSVPSASVSDLYEGMRTVALDPALRQELQHRGRERAATFSWTRNAQETALILDRVAREADGRRASRKGAERGRTRGA